MNFSNLPENNSINSAVSVFLGAHESSSLSFGNLRAKETAMRRIAREISVCQP